MSNLGRTAAVQMRTEETMVEALRLRRDGMSYRAIGEAIGISHVHVQRLIQRGLDRIAAPDVVGLRAEELAHLDELGANLRPRCETGDPAAVAIAIRLSESRRKLMGLDAPTQIMATVERVEPYLQPDAQYAELHARLAVQTALNQLDQAAIEGVQ